MRSGWNCRCGMMDGNDDGDVLHSKHPTSIALHRTSLQFSAKEYCINLLIYHRFRKSLFVCSRLNRAIEATRAMDSLQYLFFSAPPRNLSNFIDNCSIYIAGLPCKPLTQNGNFYSSLKTSRRNNVPRCRSKEQ